MRTPINFFFRNRSRNLFLQHQADVGNCRGRVVAVNKVTTIGQVQKRASLFRGIDEIVPPLDVAAGFLNEKFRMIEILAPLSTRNLESSSHKKQYWHLRHRQGI